MIFEGRNFPPKGRETISVAKWVWKDLNRREKTQMEGEVQIQRVWFALFSINILTETACHGLNAPHPFFGLWLSWTLDRHRLTSRAVRNVAAIVTWQAPKVLQIALSISGTIILRFTLAYLSFSDAVQRKVQPPQLVSLQKSQQNNKIF